MGQETGKLYFWTKLIWLVSSWGFLIRDIDIPFSSHKTQSKQACQSLGWKKCYLEKVARFRDFKNNMKLAKTVEQDNGPFGHRPPLRMS